MSQSFEDFADIREVEKAQEARAVAERRIRTLEGTVKRLTAERDELAELFSLASSLEAEKLRPPKWLAPKKRGTGHPATACLLVTDTHFDEVVSPDELDGLNAYNREIAEIRLRRCFERTVMLSRDYLSGITYDGAVLMLGGDLLSGIIHEELRESNFDTLFGSILHWVEHLRAGLDMLLEEFGRVHVVAVPGNHGRLGKKPRYKLRARDNADWFLAKLLVREFRGDDRVTFTVPEAMDAHVSVYSTRFLLTHGDQFRGGSGISGAMSPLMLGTHRKTGRELAAERPYDFMVMGHWHQRIYVPGRGLLVGGCLKGYDEFAYGNNFVYEPPTQEFFIVTPGRGITVTAPIFVMDRKQEGW